MPRVSVISGAYNLAKSPGLDESVNSILSQSFRDFEFIICDDKSSDETLALLSAHAMREPRIKIISNEENLGHAAALNRCIEEATGEYIARHDLDDVSAPERLKKQIEYLDSHPEISVLGCAAYLFDESGVFAKEEYPAEVKNEDFLFTSPYKHGSVVFRKEALLNIGGYRVAKETRRAEDYDLFMRMQSFSRGANLKEALYYFREDKNTLKRRKYKYRIDEAKVRFSGFKSLGLLPRGIAYVIKPLAVGLIPPPWLKKLKRRRNGKWKEKY